jgi:branched-chain amino acid transport system substrate-binding protein
MPTRYRLLCLGWLLLAPPAMAAETVKIAVLEDMAGLFSDFGGRGSVIAAELAIQDHGGVAGGKRVELLSADHQNRPDIGSGIATKWLDVDGVDAIVGVPTSNVALAVQEITRVRHKIFLSTAATSDLTGRFCSPTGFHWGFDTYALATVAGRSITQQGGNSWFFITADFAFGQALERDTTAVVRAAGGTVLGSIRHPMNGSDFSGPLLQAQTSGAKVIGLANAGADIIATIKQAAEFGIGRSQQLAALLIFITDVHALGLEIAQGLQLTTGFYWAATDETRAFSARFMQLHGGKAPSQTQAAVYSAINHYLKAVDATGGDTDGLRVAAAIRAMPVHDFMSKDAIIRADGQVMRSMYQVRVKRPSEQRFPWDYYTVLSEVPGDEAFRPLAQGGCIIDRP